MPPPLLSITLTTASSTCDRLLVARTVPTLRAMRLTALPTISRAKRVTSSLAGEPAVVTRFSVPLSVACVGGP
ncbi:hypothetical protein [uncultured Sphingomonas sp.]|uniref:hypothetical protein n=1 Tax=uncultured Sphingomonas sp. TaxID=158754 RepID=UPI00261F863D|nr:hypothetical protein [uncultured Sphingomonas sp.]